MPLQKLGQQGRDVELGEGARRREAQGPRRRDLTMPEGGMGGGLLRQDLAGEGEVGQAYDRLTSGQAIGKVVVEL